jgi:fructuronate reductase
VVTQLPRLSKACAASGKIKLSLTENILGNDIANVNRLGIVHLGVGAFHRAHQAWYTEKAMGISGGDWRITGVSLRSTSVAERLNPQDGLFTLIEQDASGTKHSIIRVIDKVLVATQAPQLVLAELCAKRTRIVSLTITEKGYCHDPATGCLNLSHPDILHDLKYPDAPRSAIGFLVLAMKARINHQMPPFTVLSCDNLPANGNLLRGLVLAFASEISQLLPDAIDRQYSFPNSMVDRIVPAVTPDTFSHFSQSLGYSDHALVVTERFSQWIIEDNFVSGRPDWEAAGALMVNDVHAFEIMKLRLLNGSHSAIAYLGYLSGLKTVAEAMQIEGFQRFIQALMHKELMPSIEKPEGIDLIIYSEQLIKRFLNPNLHHQTYQIAMDGSQKLPQRLLNPLRFQCEHGGCVERITLTIAAWIQYTSGIDLQGEKIEVQDPLASRLQRLYQTRGSDLSAWVSGVFELHTVFDETRADNQQLISKTAHWLALLRQSMDPIKVIDSINRGETP